MIMMGKSIRHIWVNVPFQTIVPHIELGFYMSLVTRNLSSGFATRVDSNRPAQPQRLARVLKFRI